MLCMDCGRREAVVFLKMAVNNKVTDAHLCAVCAAKKGAGPALLEQSTGVGDYRSGDKPSFPGQKGGAVPAGYESGSLNIPDILGGINGCFKEFLPAGKKALHCPACALTYREFKETGKLGCSVCYVSFDAQLSELLTRAYGSCLHTGKVYATRAAKSFEKCDSAATGKRERKAQTARRLKGLNAELKAAVDREDFETAARLRDQIKKLG
ncbi:MAG: UvrB/UvrC motif-containing protein [Elusimicrobia bacterium]|nr:UvrB/UvrC motif-containing protein [Elusimicrobiota bacterium]